MHNETTIAAERQLPIFGLRIYDRWPSEDIDLLTRLPELHPRRQAPSAGSSTRADIAFCACRRTLTAITAADLVEGGHGRARHLDHAPHGPPAERTAGAVARAQGRDPYREERIACPAATPAAPSIAGHPLVEAGILPPDALLTCYSLTGQRRQSGAGEGGYPRPGTLPPAVITVLRSSTSTCARCAPSGPDARAGVLRRSWRDSTATGRVCRVRLPALPRQNGRRYQGRLRTIPAISCDLPTRV